ncbi:hypothetical protein PTTG_03316 [Puccinia triticina 1-1 BBBD Race 1]|uniref:Uncharacterized protein n=1 Tax=Puccinia triticina (isolate 1-1 / race 1 (BBBD)) TaxID=630390 RepID=A0A180G4N6_PUCT1|nr:hypothetical protein PTTG_03316 [Puccinia triticina 1-1 BBBD Race 1]
MKFRHHRSLSSAAKSQISMDSPPNNHLPASKLLPLSGTAPDGQLDSGSVNSTAALDTLKGPAPSLEAYANYKTSLPPTLLRSERKQAGKKEYVTSCSKLEEIIQQALGLSESIPVTPATIISGLRNIHDQCRKRKQDVREGKPIPPEDLIDLTNESDEDEDRDQASQRHSPSKPPAKRLCIEDTDSSSGINCPHPELPSKVSNVSPSTSQDNPNPLGAVEDIDDAQSPAQHMAPSTSQDFPGHQPKPTSSSTSAAATTEPGLATTQLSSGSNSNLSITTSTRAVINPAPALPSSTGAKSPSDLGLILHMSGPSIPPPANITDAPLLQPPPAPMITLRAAPTGGPTPAPTAPSAQTAAPSTSTPQPSSITFIQKESLRFEVHSILKTFQGHLNRQKFLSAHNSVNSFIDCRAKSMHKRTPPPELPQFSLFQSESKHKVWLKEIQTYLDVILLPANDEPWYAPSLINIPQLKSAKLPELKASKHVEYPLVLLLREIQKPSKVNLSRWANCIASSIQLTAQEFAVKPPPINNLDNTNLGSHLRIIEYLNSCKASTPEMNAEDGKIRNEMSLKPLIQFHDLILDIFITYSIIRGSALADAEPDTPSAESQALVLQKKELDQHRSRHNYTPFCLYLVAGVRGLILAPNNRQFASGASALGFLGAIEHIFKNSIPQREGLEPVWKRTGAYIDSVFIDAFLTPNCLFNFHRLQITQLAQAITSDFLVCLQNQFPAKQFQVPRAVAAK